MSSSSLASFAQTGAACVFKGCRGFFHPGAGSLGVVLCAPWGDADLRARAGWRALAEAIAGAGYPCLRFDYRGTGESIGAMTEIADVADWTGTIDSAADFLRAYSGVKTFVFVGQGLGAGLAMQAAGQRSDVVGLALATPIVNGRAYVLGLAGAPHAGGVTVGGFALGASLLDSLRRFDATKSATGGVTQVIVLDRVDRKAGAEVSEFYKRSGLATRFVPLESHREPGSADLTARILEALRAIKPVAATAAMPRVPLLPATLRTREFREEPLPIGDHETGMLCLPVQATAPDSIFVFVPEDGASRIGWGRAFVDQTRALAAVGFASLRLDTSLSAEEGPSFDLLAARGFTRIVLVGIGGGATTALSAAGANRRVTAVIAVNPPYLVRDQTEDQGDSDGGRGLARRLYFSVVPAAARERLAPFGRALLAFGSPKLRGLTMSRVSAASVRDLFTSLSDRGARVSMVYGDTDSGLRALRVAFGPFGRDLRLPGTSVSIMPGADARVTNPDAAAMLLDHMIAVAREGGADGDRREAA